MSCQAMQLTGRTASCLEAVERKLRERADFANCAAN